MYPLFMDDPAEEAYATCIARPDVMVGASGPKFVEFNIGSGIGGVVDTSLHSAAWTAAFGGAHRAPFRAVDPLTVRDDLFLRAVRDLAVKPAVAIVGTLRDLGGRPSRYFELQAESLRRRGLDAEFFEPEELADGLGLPARPRFQLGLRHFTVLEWREHGIDFAPVRAALDMRLQADRQPDGLPDRQQEGARLDLAGPAVDDRPGPGRRRTLPSLDAGDR